MSQPLPQSPPRVTIIGGGYIGYPLGVLLASCDIDVVIVDIDPAVVSDINGGVVRSVEPEVTALASRPAVREHLRASLTPDSASVFIIAVPTPLRDGDTRSDLTMVEAAARSIVPHLQPGTLVIIESTIPPGTTESVVGPILAESGLEIGSDVLLAHCPERLHPGATLQELRGNDRIIGGIDPASTAAARQLYERFTTGAIVETDAITAELCKLFENTYRDVSLALANQLAGIAEYFGIPGTEALEIASRHPRVQFLRPGIGVGGHCIPIDPWFLHEVTPDLASLVVTARGVNDNREEVVADRIANRLEESGGTVVVIAGVAYKPNVSDERGSPALNIARRLESAGYEVRIHDPLVPRFGGSLLEAADGADLLAITVPHEVMMREVELQRDELSQRMRTAHIIDISTGWPEEL